MKSFIIIIIGLVASWHFTDLAKAGSFYNLFMPFMAFVFLVSLAIWLVTKMGLGSHISNSGGIDGNFGDSGGDAGGGGDC